MMRMSSTVCSTSARTWLETTTVRPSAASLRRNVRSHSIPSGSRPLAGSSRMRTSGSPRSAAAEREALLHAGRVALDRALRPRPRARPARASRPRARRRRRRRSRSRAARCARSGRGGSRRSRGARRPSRRARAAPGSGCRGSSPTRPSGRTRSRIMRRVVVLPAPLGPSTPVMVPASIAKLTSSTARTFLPKRLDRCSALMTGMEPPGSVRAWSALAESTRGARLPPAGGRAEARGQRRSDRA